MRELQRAEAIIVLTDYERRNRFASPLVRLLLSRLTGERYDGSMAARERVAEQLPMLAFRPRRRATGSGTALTGWSRGASA